MAKLFVILTAHNPLERFDTTLRVLQEYGTFSVDVEAEIFIDHDSEKDVSTLRELIDANVSKTKVGITVADPCYTGYSLCWAHKALLKQKVRDRYANYYMYSENDMLFRDENFCYWLDEKDSLKRKNLEPGFCRFERVGEDKIPFDNFRRWSLLGPTPACWGDIPHYGQFTLTPYRMDMMGFVSLGNPYAGLMILDQEDAEKYVKSPACDPQKSYAMTGKRNWPIADRSSMGLCFSGLRPEQEHRRVVPVVYGDESLVVADYALVEHLDTKYSQALLTESDIITTDTMLAH